MSRLYWHSAPLADRLLRRCCSPVLEVTEVMVLEVMEVMVLEELEVMVLEELEVEH